MIQQRELARADEHILELRPKSWRLSGAGAPAAQGRGAAAAARRADGLCLLRGPAARDVGAGARDAGGPRAGRGLRGGAPVGGWARCWCRRRRPTALGTRGCPQAARPLGRGGGARGPGALRGGGARGARGLAGQLRRWVGTAAGGHGRRAGRLALSPTQPAWAPSASTCARFTARWPSGSGPPPAGGCRWPTATRCCTGTTRCTPGELRARPAARSPAERPSSTPPSPRPSQTLRTLDCES